MILRRFLCGELPQKENKRRKPRLAAEVRLSALMKGGLYDEDVLVLKYCNVPYFTIMRQSSCEDFYRQLFCMKRSETFDIYIHTSARFVSFPSSA